MCERCVPFYWLIHCESLMWSSITRHTKIINKNRAYLELELAKGNLFKKNQGSEVGYFCVGTSVFKICIRFIFTWGTLNSKPVKRLFKKKWTPQWVLGFKMMHCFWCFYCNEWIKGCTMSYLPVDLHNKIL